MYLPTKFAGACTPPEAPIATIEAAVAFAKRQIAARALERIGRELKTKLHNAQVLEFHIFGGACLRGTPNDLDLAPAVRSAENFQKLARRFFREPSSQYGQTVLDGVKVQFCMTEPSAIKQLVDDFDFAHCRVGATMSRDQNFAMAEWKVKEVYLGAPFIAAMLTQGTYYAGGRWPMRSLSRVAKVAMKLGLSQDEAHALSLQIMAEMVEQGFDEVAQTDPRFIELVTKGEGQEVSAMETAPAPGEEAPFETMFGAQKTVRRGAY